MTFSFAQGHRQTLAILNSGGGFFVAPQACKDWIHDSICAYLYPSYAQLYSIWNGCNTLRSSNNEALKPSLDSPDFVLFCGKKSRERNSRKFAILMNEIEECMGVDGRTEVFTPDSGVSKNSGPFVARAPSFWLRSPVLVSAYCLFLRLSIRMQLDEAFDDFVKRVCDDQKQAYDDAHYLRKAVSNGNMEGLLECSLPCMHREGFSDYLLSEHGRGFAWYHAKSDAMYPMDEKSLKVLRLDGRKARLNRA